MGGQQNARPQSKVDRSPQKAQIKSGSSQQNYLIKKKKSPPSVCSQLDFSSFQTHSQVDKQGWLSQVLYLQTNKQKRRGLQRCKSFQKLRQEDCGSEISLSYIESSRPARVHIDRPCKEKKEEKKESRKKEGRNVAKFPPTGRCKQCLLITHKSQRQTRVRVHLVYVCVCARVRTCACTHTFWVKRRLTHGVQKSTQQIPCQPRPQSETLSKRKGKEKKIQKILLLGVVAHAFSLSTGRQRQEDPNCSLLYPPSETSKTTGTKLPIANQILLTKLFWNRTTPYILNSQRQENSRSCERDPVAVRRLSLMLMLLSEDTCVGLIEGYQRDIRLWHSR